MAGFFNQGGFGAFGGLGGFGMGGMGAPTVFEESYRCFSMAVAGKQAELEQGDKIILPASALDALTRMHVQYPMMFRVEAAGGKKDEKTGKPFVSHCGVSEFSAPEGRCFFPHWLMTSMGIAEGAFVFIRNVSLPKGRFVRLQPHQKAFLSLSNPRAVLEKTLRSFSCLTPGQSFPLSFAGQTFNLSVLETKPEGGAIGIIETDLEVDFAPPKDYQQPLPPQATSSSSASAAGAGAGTAGVGAGKALGSGSSPIVIDGEDDDEDKKGGAGGQLSGGKRSFTAASLDAALPPPKFQGGSGTVSGGPASSSSSSSASAQSLAAQAALKRLQAMKAAAAGGVDGAAGGPPPSKFQKQPAVVPFAGTGYKVGTGEAVSPASTASAGAGAGGAGSARSRGASDLKEGDASPSVGGLFQGSGLSNGGGAAGGAAGARPGSAKPRTLNRFEQARAEKAFQGTGRTIRD